MDIQTEIEAAIRNIRKVIVAAGDQLTLGDFIDRLEPIAAENGAKTIVFDFEYAVPTRFDSWRGVYAELALGFAFYREKPVGELLQSAKAAVGKTFTGYKGGEYVMTRDTTLWVANYGNSGNTAIVGVFEEEWQVVILTAYRPM